MQNLRDVIIAPVLTEKSNTLKGKGNQYVFKVAPACTKSEIKIAVEKIFGVKVTGINTMNVIGKKKRVRIKEGYTASWKKAIVTLKAGDKIQAFEGA